MAEQEPTTEAFNRMRRPEPESHHQHHIHELGRGELKLAEDILAEFKKLLRSNSRIEAKLDAVSAKLDVISVSTEERAELEAFRTVALPAMVSASEQLNVFTPES